MTARTEPDAVAQNGLSESRRLIVKIGSALLIEEGNVGGG